MYLPRARSPCSVQETAESGQGYAEVKLTTY